MYRGDEQVFGCWTQLLRATKGTREGCSNYLETDITEVIVFPDFTTLKLLTNSFSRIVDPIEFGDVR